MLLSSPRLNLTHLNAGMASPFDSFFLPSSFSLHQPVWGPYHLPQNTYPWHLLFSSLEPSHIQVVQPDPRHSLLRPQPLRRKVKGLKYLDTVLHLQLHPPPSSQKGKYGISQKKGQIKSNKVIQLIIILIDSSEFTARPRKVGKGGQRGQTWGAPSWPSPSGESKEPPAKFSFSHLLLFFFFLIGIYFKCRLGRKVVGGQVARSVCVAVCECVEACLME